MNCGNSVAKAFPPSFPTASCCISVSPLWSIRTKSKCLCLANIRSGYDQQHPYEPNGQVVKYKVKCTLEEATKAQRGSRGIALLLFNLGARWGGSSTSRRGRFTPGKDPVPIV
jgi:hypothetical protein